MGREATQKAQYSSFLRFSNVHFSFVFRRCGVTSAKALSLSVRGGCQGQVGGVGTACPLPDPFSLPAPLGISCSPVAGEDPRKGGERKVGNGVRPGHCTGTCTWLLLFLKAVMVYCRSSCFF